MTMSPNDAWGKGGSQPECYVTFFDFVIFELNFTTKVLKKLCFCKLKIVTSHRVRTVSPNDTWGGKGSKNRLKKCHVFF